MGLYIRTKLARRRMRRRNGYGFPMWVVIAALIVCASIWLLHLLRPKLAEYAVNYVQYQATTMMERSVAACTAEMEHVGNIQTDETGAVTSIATNTAAMNTLRTAVVQQVYTDIGALETAHTSVAIGTLLDPQYLAGIGPQLPFGVTALGCVTAEVQSDFSSSGINQTLYTVVIRVTAEFAIHSLGKTENVTISAEYPLEETIVVGEVPLIAANS